MSGRKNRIAKRTSGIHVNAIRMKSANKMVSADMKSEAARRDRVDKLIRSRADELVCQAFKNS